MFTSALYKNTDFHTIFLTLVKFKKIIANINLHFADYYWVTLFGHSSFFFCELPVHILCLFLFCAPFQSQFSISYSIDRMFCVVFFKVLILLHYLCCNYFTMPIIAVFFFFLNMWIISFFNSGKFSVTCLFKYCLCYTSFLSFNQITLNPSLSSLIYNCLSYFLFLCTLRFQWLIMVCFPVQ